MRCRAPIHNSISGVTGFLTRTIVSFSPFKASAISCVTKGLVVVRAPIHKTSTPASSASLTCSLVATSVAISIPVSSLARINHLSPLAPTPSNVEGLERGFHSPALNTFIPILHKAMAVSRTCFSVSALHGPAITL